MKWGYGSSLGLLHLRTLGVWDATSICWGQEAVLCFVGLLPLPADASGTPEVYPKMSHTWASCTLGAKIIPRLRPTAQKQVRCPPGPWHRVVSVGMLFVQVGRIWWSDLYLI